MSLIKQAQTDFQRISKNSNEFGQTVMLFDVAGNQLEINGLYTRHHLGFDTDGNRVNTTQASVALSIRELDANYYDYFSANVPGQITFKGHRVNTPDGYKYAVREWFPDETLECVVLILQKYT